MRRIGIAWVAVMAAVLPAAAAWAAEPVLDYEFFKARVQPIFTTKRVGNARCASCHSTGTPMRLQALPAGSATWNEEDSRKNFDVIRARVIAGEPAKSKLLLRACYLSTGISYLTPECSFLVGVPFLTRNPFRLRLRQSCPLQAATCRPE